MNTPLKIFRDAYLDMLQQFLWREWTTLGVAGQEEKPVGHIIDPEALLLLTATLGRYDQRLFDEVLEWLTVNGRFINIQRLKNILRYESFGGGQVLSAIADWLSKRNPSIKWRLLAKATAAKEQPEILFFLPDGRPLPDSKDHDPTFLAHGWMRNTVALRGNSQAFSSEKTSNFFLKMRALFGINTRSDALVYLALNRSGHPRAIAREMYYSQKAVHEVLTDLACSDVVHSARIGRERTFRITPSSLSLFQDKANTPIWINWPILLATAETVWLMVERLHAAHLDPLLESSEIMLTTTPLLQRLIQAAWMPSLPAQQDENGVDRLYVFQTLFEAIAK
jgi:hypothetical protein